MRQSQATNIPISDDGLIEKAVSNAAARLNISDEELSTIFNSGGNLSLFDCRVLFVRLFRSLDSIVGGDDSVAAEWVRNHNTALGAAPISKIKSVNGLNEVVSYLDSRRAII